MKPKVLIFIAALGLLSAPAAARAQSTAPPAPPAQQSQPATPAQPAEPFDFATTLLVRGNFLGVRTEEVTRENLSRYGMSGEPRGVGVREVVKGSPAERAGLRQGDVILRFDGEQVSSVRKLTRLIEESAPEHAARLTVLRGGAEQELSATLTRREPFISAGAIPFEFGDRLKIHPEQWEHRGEEMRRRLEELGREQPGLFSFGSSRRIGVTTSTLGKQLADYFGVQHGVLISSVEANSPADRAGLKAGDVVTEADGRKVDDASDLVGALGGKDEGEVTLTVVRDRKQRTVRVTPERRQGPQGLNLTPGSYRVVRPPVAAVTAPGAIRLPHALVAPLAPAAPRAPRAPRVRAFRPGGRIL